MAAAECKVHGIYSHDNLTLALGHAKIPQCQGPNYEKGKCSRILEFHRI